MVRVYVFLLEQASETPMVFFTELHVPACSKPSPIFCPLLTRLLPKQAQSRRMITILAVILQRQRHAQV